MLLLKLCKGERSAVPTIVWAPEVEDRAHLVLVDRALNGRVILERTRDHCGAFCVAAPVEVGLRVVIAHQCHYGGTARDQFPAKP